MQMSLPLEEPRALAVIDRRLRAAYGPVPSYARLDPVSQLVLAILGARTRGAVSMAVFEGLWEEFGDWAGLREASAATVEPLIGAVTYPENKAKWLPAALRQITERRGALDLDFLETWPVEAARRWLETLDGVGPKASAAVLNFSTLGMRALVVDTHYYRVAKRLGVLPARTAFPAAHRLLTRQLPDDWSAAALDDHFELMKAHGQKRCRHANPICEGCPLADLCAMRRGEKS